MPSLPLWHRIASIALATSLVLFSPTQAQSSPVTSLQKRDKTQSDYFVHHLPGAPLPLLKQHAGHIEITPEHNGNLFFWLYHNRHIADKQRLVIWINGGPGCSSEDGALMEIGPYRVQKDGNLAYNNGSWDEFANVLFVDNPVGTGFSYVNTDSFLHELDEMASQFVQFLDKFFGIFPEYSHDDIYLAGESYAGQHIPHIAKAILDRNKASQPDQQWSLGGLLIGNGWISGPDQYPSYLQYAYKNGLIKANTPQSTAVEKQQNICNEELSKGGKDHVDVSSCEAILSSILYESSTGTGEDRMCYNMYDIRLRDKHPSCGMNWPPDLENVTPYLRRKDVMEALHINNVGQRTGWTECNGQVGTNFNARNSIPSIKLLPDLLEQVPITLFSGDQDLICNHLGTEELIHNLEWKGGKGFELSPGTWAPRRAWTVANEPAGFYQEARNLTYVLFYNSSHMVPFDYPRRSRAMLDRFIGVDISTIGGAPVVSVVGGDKDALTSVGGTLNSTLAEQEQETKIKDAQWAAYRKSGEVALVIVAFAAGAWGFFIWRSRRSSAGYQGVWTRDPDGGGRGLGLDAISGRKGSRRGDVEAADFDENELDDLASGSSAGSGGRPQGNGQREKRIQMEDEERERFSLGQDSDDEDDGAAGKKAQN